MDGSVSGSYSGDRGSADSCVDEEGRAIGRRLVSLRGFDLPDLANAG